MEKYSTLEVNDTFSDRQWEAYWELIQQIQRAKNEPSIINSWQELKRSCISGIDNTRLREVMISSEEEPVGRLRLRKRSEDFVEMEMETKYEQASSSLLHYITGLLLHVMNDLGIDKVSCKTSNNTLNQFLKSIGAKVINHYFHYHLERSKANNQQINEWLSDIPVKNPNLTLRLYSGLPEELIDAYAGMFIDLLADMPRDASLPPQPMYSVENIKRDLKMDKLYNRQTWTGILFEDDKIIGQTNLVIYHNNPHHAFQFMTGVRKDYRGRGLAQWMKAAMFNHLLTLKPQPEMIYTGTYSLNLPMQKINFAMGYELQKEGYEYTLHRKELNGYFNS